MERTLVLLKPDAMERRIAGEILTRLERKGFILRGMKLTRLSPELARKHYAKLADEPFFPRIEAYITRSPLIAIVLEGQNAISVLRGMVGPTDSAVAPPGTIRGDYSLSFAENLVHASDSPDSAAREIDLFFQPGALVD